MAETVRKRGETTVPILVISVIKSRKGESLQQYTIKSNLTPWGLGRVL